MEHRNFEPISPELVLVCPELRTVALLRERDFEEFDPARSRPVAAMGSRPTRSRSTFPLTAAVLAVSLALGGYALGRRSAAEGENAVLATVSAHTVEPADREQTQLKQRDRHLQRTAVSAPMPVPTKSADEPPGRRAAARPRPQLRLSADGVYVTSLGPSPCPGAPRLPWLLVAGRRFAWQGELNGISVSVSGRLLPGDVVRGRAVFRGPRCHRAVTLRGRAAREVR